MSQDLNASRTAGRVLLCLCLLATAACGGPVASTQSTATKSPPMTRFIQALQKKDTRTFLSFFSTTVAWNYVSTITDPPMSTKIQFKELKADLEGKKGWYESLFDAGGDDCFRDWVMGTDGSNWVEKRPCRFVRQQVEGKDTVYVEWRKEGNRWVVATIAEPAA